MPINKDALKRYRIIDEMLSDPNNDYTTDNILRAVNRECEHVTIRMIQKDIKSIEEYFGKSLVRNAMGRGTVKYEDQSTPLFYKELTLDEEDLLREVLKTLGQFDGLDNFQWLDLLKRKLSVNDENNRIPIISFSKNDGLQIPATLLGHLFTAISRKKVIKLTYTKFGAKPSIYIVYPYQLKQYNNRWFLLCTQVGDKQHSYKADYIMTLALDRISEKIEYIDEEQYIETPIDLNSRFDEIIGVTLNMEQEPEDIYFAVSPLSLPYVRTKWLHNTQIELNKESQEVYREKYPSLKDYTFFSIECRENIELYNLFGSFTNNIVLVEPKSMRDHIHKLLEESLVNYNSLFQRR